MLVDTLVYRVKVVDVEALCQPYNELDVEMLIYALADRLPLVEEEKDGNTPTKVEGKAVLHTLAARETEVNSTHLATRCLS